MPSAGARTVPISGCSSVRTSTSSLRKYSRTVSTMKGRSGITVSMTAVFASQPSTAKVGVNARARGMGPASAAKRYALAASAAA